MYCFSSTHSRRAARYSSSEFVKRRAAVADLLSGTADSAGERDSVVAAPLAPSLAFRVAREEDRDRMLGAWDVKADGGRLCSSERRWSLSDSTYWRPMTSR